MGRVKLLPASRITGTEGIRNLASPDEFSWPAEQKEPPTAPPLLTHPTIEQSIT